jgi:hypothetical protein
MREYDYLSPHWITHFLVLANYDANSALVSKFHRWIEYSSQMANPRKANTRQMANPRNKANTRQMANPRNANPRNANPRQLADTQRCHNFQIRRKILANAYK